MITISTTQHFYWLPSPQASKYYSYHFFLYPTGKFSTSPKPWNIENGGILCFCIPESHIFVNQCKVMVRKWHPYGKKWISYPRANTSYLLRGTSLLYYPSSTILTNSPLLTNIIHYLKLKPLKKLPNLIIIKPNKILYISLNHTIPQRLSTIPNPFNTRKNITWRGIPVKEGFL